MALNRTLPEQPLLFPCTLWLGRLTFLQTRRAALRDVLVAAAGDGLHHTGIDGDGQIDEGVHVLPRDPRFQRPLDAHLASRRAAAAAGDHQPHELLLALRQAGVLMGGLEVVLERGVWQGISPWQERGWFIDLVTETAP